MIILPCLPFFFNGTYITYIFLLSFVFALIYGLFFGKR